MLHSAGVRESSAATTGRMEDGKGMRKVRGMFVKGMGRSLFRIIPLTDIPLTSLLSFRGKPFVMGEL